MSTIRYTLAFDASNRAQFAIDTERTASALDASKAPAWTALDHHQCTHCPLSPQQHRHCPAALDIAFLAEQFNELPSFQTVDVKADIGDRSHQIHTDLQTALQSLLGLMLATSACPILSRMKGPARLHMPFATVDETLFRMVGAYFIGLYHQGRRGCSTDWTLDPLAVFYAQVQNVNRHLKMRLDAITSSDAQHNAIVSLMGVSVLVSFSLDQNLANLEPYMLHTSPPAS